MAHPSWTRVLASALVLLVATVVWAAVATGADPTADDLTRPSLTFDGEFRSHRVLDGGAWDVEVTATDGTEGSPSSGVARLSVRIGGRPAQVETNDCDAATNCEQTMTFTVDADLL